MADPEALERTPSRPMRLLRWPLDLFHTLLRVIPQAIDGYFADRCAQHAAGIAYRVLFSLVPLSIVLVAIFGIVLRNDGLRDDVITRSSTRSRSRTPAARTSHARSKSWRTRQPRSGSSACSSSGGLRPE